MLLQQQKNMIDNQDKHLDKISGVVDKIRFENQQFSTEVQMQNKMLDVVNDDLDANNTQMVKLDSTLKGMLMKGSICKLWLIIILELALLIFLVMNL